MRAMPARGDARFQTTRPSAPMVFTFRTRARGRIFHQARSTATSIAVAYASVVHPTLIDPVPGVGVPGWLAPSVVIDERYRIVGPLGQGGVGAVWIAEHLGLGRRVAIKVLHGDLQGDVLARKRFDREAQTLAALVHPHIVAVNDYGVWSGTPYLVMELLAGRTLGELLAASGPLPAERAVAITQQLLRALAYAHGRSVIHRDLKPANVFLQALPDQEDHVKLLDFGFARLEGPHRSQITADGFVVGTPWYMAPEVATGAELDARADVYAVGVLLFEMLTARRPFEGEALEVIRARMNEDAPTMRRARPDLTISAGLDDIVARALARRPDDRWSTATAFARALEGVRATIAVPAPAPVAPPNRPRDELPSSTEPPIARSRSRVRWLLTRLGIVAAIALAIQLWDTTRAPEPEVDRIVPTSVVAAPIEPPAPPPSSIVVAEPLPTVIEPAIVEPAIVEPAIVEPPPPTEVAPTEPPPSVAPASPWSHDVPPDLAALRRLVDRPRTPTRHDLHTLSTYAHAHHADPRPVLLLGHAFARMHWMSECLERYQRALSMSPESRADPEVIEDLVLVATAESTARDAADLIVSTYGTEALPAIDAALAAPATSDDAHARLIALRDRLLR
jgi:serine/threonine-protein kinase